MMTFKTILIVALHIIFSLDILPLLVVQTVLSVNIDIGEVEQAVEAGNLKLSVDNIVVSTRQCLINIERTLVQHLSPLG